MSVCTFRPHIEKERLFPYRIDIFPNSFVLIFKEYELAGAVVREDLDAASLIVGVKQVPLEKLIPNRTYVFFSHTIKAQEASMPMLDEMLQKVRLICHL